MARLPAGLRWGKIPAAQFFYFLLFQDQFTVWLLVIVINQVGNNSSSNLPFSFNILFNILDGWGKIPQQVGKNSPVSGEKFPSKRTPVYLSAVKSLNLIYKFRYQCYDTGLPEVMKTYPDIWDPSLYRRLRSDHARRSYIKHLLGLGYMKGHAPGGIVMYPPKNRYAELLAEKQAHREKILDEMRLPYKDND